MTMARSRRMSDQSIRRLIAEALSRNDINEAEQLVDEIVDMHEKAFALSQAVRTHNRPAVQAFLLSKCDPFLKHQGITALVLAIRTDDVYILKLLLDGCLPLTRYDKVLKEDHRKSLRVKRGTEEALFEAAAVGASQCLDYLLHMGVDCNTYFYHDDEFLSWCTPLIAACYGPLSTVCRGVSREDATNTIIKLVDHGADINKTNHLGDTSLHWAAGAGLTAAVSVLLRNGADINHQNKIGKSPLMTLGESFKKNSGNDFLKVASILLQHSVDLTLMDTDGWTALHFAVESMSTDLVRMLLESGANPNPQFSSDLNQFHSICCLSLAVMHNSLDMVKLLLHWNTLPHTISTIHPFTVACEQDNIIIARLLIEAGLPNSVVLVGIRNLLNKPSLNRDNSMCEEWRELSQAATEPFPLLLQCRTVIRKRLAKRVVAKDLDLCLPTALLAYIKLQS